MKKLIIAFVSILLLAGVAQAVDLDSAVTAEFSAQNTGRSIATDSSVILKVWYKGSGDNPSVGVSGNTINLYDSGTADATVDTTDASYDTPGEVVDYINSLDNWIAKVGPDSYRDYASESYIIASDNSYIGSNEATAANIYDDSSESTKVLVGVAADATSRIRLKNISQQIPSNGDNITISIYDGNTKIWQKYIPSTTYNTYTAASASPNTVIPTNDDKGLASTKGNSLCVVIDTDGAVDTDATSKASLQASITYDKLRD